MEFNLKRHTRHTRCCATICCFVFSPKELFQLNVLVNIVFTLKSNALHFNFLQVIHARFGKKAHVVFCCFALLTNLVITIGILLAGRATIQSLTKDASDEFTLLTMAVLFGSYSLIGGLGTTFYVSYFNACLVFVLLIVFVIKIWHTTDDEHESIGNVEKMYHSITCIHGPEENYDYSYLTFRSGVALLYGVLEVSHSEPATFRWLLISGKQYGICHLIIKSIEIDQRLVTLIRLYLFAILKKKKKKKKK